jgi:hypothetical protein
MPTLIVKDSSIHAQQFLAFARTLPYIDFVDDVRKPARTLKKSVMDTLKKTERGKELIVCEDANDMFNKLGI